MQGLLPARFLADMALSTSVKADSGTGTRDLDHGAIALYHLSYARINLPQVPADGIEPPLS